MLPHGATHEAPLSSTGTGRVNSCPHTHPALPGESQAGGRREHIRRPAQKGRAKDCALGGEVVRDARAADPVVLALDLVECHRVVELRTAVDKEVQRAAALRRAGSEVVVAHGSARSLNAFYLVWRDWGFVPEEYDYVQWGNGPGGGHQRYPLRPELIESTYLLHRATAEPSWLWAGRDFIDSLQRWARTSCRV